MNEATGTRTAPLEMTPAEFREAGHRAVDAVADLLARCASGR